MRYAAVIFVLLCSAVYAAAQENTEVQGFYQGYGKFSWKTGSADLDFPATKLTGGGFGIAYNLAPWFAMWTQIGFNGRVDSASMSFRVINELQGVRYQTKQYGPFRLYGKGGVGFAHYSIEVLGSTLGSYRPCFSYSGGAQIWLRDWIGLNLEAGQILMGVPNLTDLPGRDSWDAGFVYSTGIAIRF